MPDALVSPGTRRRRRLLVGAGALAAAVVLTSTAPAFGATSIRSLISSTASGKTVPLTTATYAYSDFDGNLMGLDIRGKGGIAGTGVGKSILQMNPRSSTKARSVPTASGTVNKLFLLYATGSPALSGFTLQGTDQGHTYNGVMLSSTTNARLSNLKVAAVPGNDHVNPGETFGIDENRGSGSVYDHVEVDGAGVGAAGVGVNNSKNITFKNSSFHNNVYSAGITFFQSTGMTLTDLSSYSNKTGFNLERTTGTATITRPTFSGNRVDVHISNDWGSTPVKIYDPKFSGKLKVQLNTTYFGHPNLQKKSDVHVYINGVDKTSSVVQWLT